MSLYITVHYCCTDSVEPARAILGTVRPHTLGLLLHYTYIPVALRCTSKSVIATGTLCRPSRTPHLSQQNSARRTIGAEMKSPKGQRCLPRLAWRPARRVCFSWYMAHPPTHPPAVRCFFLVIVAPYPQAEGVDALLHLPGTYRPKSAG